VLVLGLSALYHESACALFQDGHLVAAAAEERFSRIKHDAALPVEAYRFCLDRVGAAPCDLDAVAWYEEPVAKLSRQIASGRLPATTADPLAVEHAVRERLGWEGPLQRFPHHLSHAASAYYCSGFTDAALLTADGVGEWATTTAGRASGDDLELFEQVAFPHSLGLLYSTITAYLGFRVDADEYKVMGLAPYGEPRFLATLRRSVADGPGFGFTLDLSCFDFVSGRRMWSPALEERLGVPPREPRAPLDAVHADLAASVQALLEEMLLGRVRWLAGEVASENLAMAGGVALNCVANARLRRDGPFRRLFVQPAAGDAGGAVGAAALAHRRLTGRRPATGATGAPLGHVRLGPSWTGDEVAALLATAALDPAPEDFRGRPPEALAEAVAARLADGQVVGWFQGAMELGPRALGGRAILADPRRPEMRDRINARVKHRESFRPFAPAVLATEVHEHFALTGGAAAETGPFMLETHRVVSPLDLPAVTHVDGSARPHVVDPAVDRRLAALLAAFARRTGCPVLLETSFNVAGEPIVCTPADALLTTAAARLDAVAIEDHLVDGAALPENLGELAAAWHRDRHRPWSEGGAGGNLYAFV
jgi:carbamoyltransferase